MARKYNKDNVKEKTDQVKDQGEKKSKRKFNNVYRKFYPNKAASHRFISYVVEKSYPNQDFKISKVYLNNFREFVYLFSEEKLSDIISHNQRVKKKTLDSHDITVFLGELTKNMNYYLPQIEGIIHNKNILDGSEEESKIINSLYTLPQFKRLCVNLGSKRISEKSHQEYLKFIFVASKLVILNSISNCESAKRKTLLSRDILAYLNRSDQFKSLSNLDLSRTAVRFRPLF